MRQPGERTTGAGRRPACAQQDLSAYEKYSRLSDRYDRIRIPFGLGRVCEAIGESARLSGRETADLQILDAGCGTGQFIARLAAEVRFIVGLDGSAGMLQTARARAGNLARAALLRGSVLALPYADRSFDGVLNNQVLHHLPPEPTPSAERYGPQRQFLAEAFRVLAPGGALWIGTCNQEQLRPPTSPYWYLNVVVPEAAHALADRYVPMDRLEELLLAVGFRDIRCSAIVDETHFTLADYSNAEGPMDPAWRSGDSVFAWYNDAQDRLAEHLRKRLVPRIENGTIQAEINTSEARRARVGHGVLLTAQRP